MELRKAKIDKETDKKTDKKNAVVMARFLPANGETPMQRDAKGISTTEFMIVDCKQQIVNLNKYAFFQPAINTIHARQ